MTETDPTAHEATVRANLRCGCQLIESDHDGYTAFRRFPGCTRTHAGLHIIRKALNRARGHGAD